MPIGAKIFDIAFTVFIYLLAAAILVAAILFAFSTRQDKSLFGYRYYTVLTSSMAPKYEEGDVIFVKICGEDDIEEDDVITFNPSKDSDAYLTHRVVEKFKAQDGTICFKTKGDANDTADSFVIDEARVIGKVTWSIPKLGYVIRFVQLKWYLIILVAIMIAVFFQLLKRYFMIGKDEDEDEIDKKDKKKKKKKNLSDGVDTESEPDNKISEDGNEVKEPDRGADLTEGTEDPKTADDNGSDSSAEEAATAVPEKSESGSEDVLPSENVPNETSPKDE